MWLAATVALGGKGGTVKATGAPANTAGMADVDLLDVVVVAVLAQAERGDRYHLFFNFFLVEGHVLVPNTRCSWVCTRPTLLEGTKERKLVTVAAYCSRSFSMARMFNPALRVPRTLLLYRQLQIYRYTPLPRFGVLSQY